MFFKKKSTSLHVEHYVQDLYEVATPPLKSASKSLPEYFKKCPVHPEGANKLVDGPSVKKCIPFREAMSCGFVMEMWADLRVQVRQHVLAYDANNRLINDSQEYFLTMKDDTLDKDQFVGGTLHEIKICRTELGKPVALFQFPSAFGDEHMARLSPHEGWQINNCLDEICFVSNVMKLHSPHIIRTPKGYSLLIQKPANTPDLKLHIWAGLVDTDEYPLNINLPFYWTGNEFGDFLIKKGTPIAQLIPIKRDDWSVVNKGTYDIDHIKRYTYAVFSTFMDNYKRLYWHKRKK